MTIEEFLNALSSVFLFAMLQPIGCDNRVFSTLTFDQCGVCGGHNDTCDVIVGTVEGSLEPGTHIHTCLKQ